MDMKFPAALRRFLDDEDGAFIVEFAIAFPILILLSFGLLEFSLVVFDYQRAAESTRSGVRHTIINPPVANLAALLVGHVIICTSTGGTVTCDGGIPSDDPDTAPIEADVRFAEMVALMRGIYPELKEENVVLEYAGTDVGDVGEYGGLFPMVTLKLVGVRRPLMLGSLTQWAGLDYIEFPAFTTTVMGPGNYVNVAEKVTGKVK
jgi:hypothetical protein